MRILVGVAALILLLAPGARAAPLCPNTWDDTFRSSNRLFMPAPLKGYWRWHKDQAWIESNCRPRVCSHVGACGLLQIMPGTWKDLARQARASGSVFEPKLNIILSTRYAAWCSRQWLGRPRTAWEVWELQLACYNAGIGHILNAQRLCGAARTWAGIVPCLPQVTGRHAAETRGYVAKANRLRERRR